MPLEKGHDAPGRVSVRVGQETHGPLPPADDRSGSGAAVGDREVDSTERSEQCFHFIGIPQRRENLNILRAPLHLTYVMTEEYSVNELIQILCKLHVILVLRGLSYMQSDMSQFLLGCMPRAHGPPPQKYNAKCERN